jgi:hypothetical protein
MSRVGSAQTQNAGLAFARNNVGDICNLRQFQPANSMVDYGALQAETLPMVLRDLVLGNSGPMTAGRGAVNTQYNDFKAEYVNRVVPLFGTILTAAVLNARNNFLLNVVAPILETDDVNFSQSRHEFNQLDMDEIAELGIPTELSHINYNWTDTITEWAKGSSITRNLAMDPNFGESIWLEELSGLANSAIQTMCKQVIYQLLKIGYDNLIATGDTTYPQDTNKLLLAESESTMIFALDPETGIRQIRDWETKIPEMDTAIMPGGAMRYLGNIAGDTATMVQQKLSTDPVSGNVLVEFQEGPQSFKTIPLGSRRLNFIELPGWRVNMIDDRVEQPLRTIVTIGEYYPPNPKLKAEQRPRETGSRLLETEIYHQTRRMGEDHAISMRERLLGCNYWDPEYKDGTPSDSTISFAREEERRIKMSPANRPWAWNDENPAYNHKADINDESSSYAVSDKRDTAGKKNLLDMHFREWFGGLTYLPSTDEVRVPTRFGDFHLSALPNEWVHSAAARLAIHFCRQCGNGGEDVMRALGEAQELYNAIENAEWTTEYEQLLIQANLTNLYVRDGNATHLTPSTTPDRRFYPDAQKLEEWPANRHGGFDLPGKSGNLAQQAYPAGFNSGAGWQRLADEAFSEYSGWREAGMKAERVVRAFRQLLDFMREFLGTEGDMINGELAPPWIHHEDALSTLIESFIPGGSPVFIGVPQLSKEGNAAGQIELQQGTSVPLLYSNVTPNLVLVPGNERLVTNTHRFLACLNNEAFKAAVALVGIEERETPAIDNALMSEEVSTHGLIDFVLNTCQYDAGGKDDATRQRLVQRASVVTLGFFAAEAAARSTYLAPIVENRSAGKAIYSKLVEKFPLAADDTRPFGAITALQAYEAAVEKAVKDVVIEYQIDGTVPPTTFTDAPVLYLRASIMSSKKLREYNRRRRGVKWIVPADPASFYQRAEEPFLAGRGQVDLHADQKGLFSLAFNRPHQSHALASSGGYQAPAQDSLFDGLSRAPRDMMSQMFFGTGIQDDLPRRFAPSVTEWSEDPTRRYKDAMHNEYFGPWRARLEYMHKSVFAPLERLFYKAILQSPNNVNVPVAMSGAGAALFEVLMARPFIQLLTNALVLMKAGNDTIVMAVRRTNSVTVTKELRGWYHINVGMMFGTVRTNPNNIAVIPSAFPEAFIGGKGVDFMTNFEHWALPNPDKESIIGFLCPLPEGTSVLDSPLHMRNLAPYKAPSLRAGIANHKFSGFGAYYEHLLRGQKPERIDILQQTRKCLGEYVVASHVLHRGPCRYVDQETGRQFDVDGDGPIGSRRMNMAGSFAVYDGRAIRFPDLAQRYTNQTI